MAFFVPDYASLFAHWASPWIFPRSGWLPAEERVSYRLSRWFFRAVSQIPRVRADYTGAEVKTPWQSSRTSGKQGRLWVVIGKGVARRAVPRYREREDVRRRPYLEKEISEEHFAPRTVFHRLSSSPARYPLAAPSASSIHLRQAIGCPFVPPPLGVRTHPPAPPSVRRAR